MGINGSKHTMIDLEDYHEHSNKHIIKVVLPQNVRDQNTKKHLLHTQKKINHPHSVVSLPKES
jgi:hypothetical protein